MRRLGKTAASMDIECLKLDGTVATATAWRSSIDLAHLAINCRRIEEMTVNPIHKFISHRASPSRKYPFPCLLHGRPCLVNWYSFRECPAKHPSLTMEYPSINSVVGESGFTLSPLGSLTPHRLRLAKPRCDPASLDSLRPKQRRRGTRDILRQWRTCRCHGTKVVERRILADRAK